MVIFNLIDTVYVYSAQDKGLQGWLGPVGIAITQTNSPPPPFFPIHFLIWLLLIQTASHEHIPEEEHWLKGSMQTLQNHFSSRCSCALPAILS